MANHTPPDLGESPTRLFEQALGVSCETTAAIADLALRAGVYLPAPVREAMTVLRQYAQYG